MPRDYKLKISVEDDAKGARRAADALDDVGDKADRADDKVGKFGKQLGKLDAEIAASKLALKALAAEFDRTGDAAVMKSFRKESGKLKGLENLSKQLVDESERAGGPAGQGFVTKFASKIQAALPSELKIALAVAAVAVTPLIGASVAAGVIGAVGAGGIAGGIALAAQDSRVAAAATALKTRIADKLADAATPFVQFTLKGLDAIGAGFDSQLPRIRRIFADLAPQVEVLGRGIAGMFEKAGPGIEKLAHESRPLIEGLARELPRVGNAISKAFTSISKEGRGATEALLTILRVSETLITKVAEVVAVWTKFFDRLVSLQAKLPGALGESARKLRKEAEESKKAADSHDTLADSFQAVDDATEKATTSLQKWQTELDKATNTALNSREAESNWQAAIDAATQAVAENGRTLDLHTEQGRNNDKALRDLVETGKARAQATYEQTQATKGDAAAQQAALAVYQQGRQALITAAMQMGLTAQQARALADQIMAIPKEWDSIVRINGVEYAMSQIAKVEKKLNEVNGKVATTYVITYTSGQQVYSASPNRAEAKGGIVAAAQGMITHSPTVLFGERQTGGEAYIPRRGISQQRAADLIGTAASWHGLSVGGGAGPLTMTVAGDGALAGLLIKLFRSGQITIRTRSGELVKVT